MYTVGEIVKMLMDDGWELHSVRGGHRQYKHPVKSGKVTVPGSRRKDELAPGTANSIFKQAGWKEQR
jgi:predicted RNA binding protein YcfA (HicA-like mRNA interferase family)